MLIRLNNFIYKIINNIKSNFQNWFNEDKKIALITGLVVGIITHIIIITSTIMSQDGLWNSMRYSKPGDWEISLGRWGIILAEKLNFYIAIPSIATISCIIIMAITSIFIVDLFEFKNKLFIVLTSALLVVSPAFTVTLLYVYTATAYSINFLISTLAVWFIYKYKHKNLGIILSFFSLIFSLGIYQSYIGVVIGLCIMYEILNLLNNKKDYKTAFLDLIKSAIIVGISLISYYILTKIILYIKKIELSTYKGANDSNLYSIFMGLKTTIFMTFRDFSYFFFSNKIVFNIPYNRNIAFSILFIITSILILYKLVLMFKSNGYSLKEKIINTIFIIFLIVCLPIGLNIIDIIVINTEIYSLTSAQLILIIPFFMAIIDSINNIEIFKIISTLCIIYIAFTYYISANVTYTVEKMSYNQSYAVISRVRGRIEALDGYDKNMPILIAGIVGNDNYPRTNELYDYSVCDIVKGPIFHFTYHGMISTWNNFISIFLGENLPICDEKTYLKIVKSDEFKNMETFPSNNSIKIIDNTAVVKFQDDPPLP